MFPHPSPSRAVLSTFATFSALALLAGCSSGGGSADESGEPAASGGGGGGDIVIGTTDKVTSLDPAGSYDNGSFAVQVNVFPFLLDAPEGSSDVEPDIAESAEFTSDTDYTVTLKPGLTWANGHALTSSDVKFTFDRQLAINDPNGPASLLSNLDSVETPDDTTVVFHLKSANDQTFPQVLSSPAGPIVDEEVFDPDALTPSADIVAGNAFGGQYVISTYQENQTILYEPNPDYGGHRDPAANDSVTVSYFADSSNLKLAVQQGDVDVAYRSLSATDIADLENDDNVTVQTGPGGEIRYIVFNFDTQPYGSSAEDADEAKALAVRQAVADLVDRDAIADQVYKGTYTPLYSYVPEGLTGATESLKSLYGDGEGGPDADKAASTLEAAGVETPVALDLQYTPEHYGPSAGDEYALIKQQLEDSGLFTVNLKSTEWVQYSKDRTADVYPAYQLGWFPDYSDADNYLTPFFLEGGFLANHYDNPEVDELIQQQQVEGDADKRAELIGEIQDKVAADLSTVPLLQGAQVAVTGTDVQGVNLDASFKFFYAPITK
ncbi:MAG: ABC transporter substrate-binding protein [Actinomyces sp.]|jgi:peptide/nickel transport system substrate-binding protein|nr:ABC transporter substrate-binding protein [Actinomyces sp.]MCI1640951.1 ABC transporter substrate-binding protein [Actinomyces sp.]MCI1661319.1 ABC transporter substrate-binding protein [Actinomyces sp.]MCI1690327.1 ABC transporter substrate-binding protein [Actinomyces sp.]MCI1786968.1 ABC transporter substrate-binding protein [Actinomyces sp.]MCI1829466.1 ABC transporter substrate-binding protein [Actinomyces sp.]